MNETNTEISKMAVLFANELHSDQKSCYSDCRLHFCNVTQKRLSELMPENVASRRNSTKKAAPSFHNIKSLVFKIKHQYIDIHHTKNQTEICLHHVGFCF